MTDLTTALQTIARTPRLLVACDFDGTLAPIAPTPALAKIERSALEALRALSELPRTTVAVISGRSRADLNSLVEWPATVRLVGSHGLEHDAQEPTPLTPKQREILDHLTAAVRDIARSAPGFVIEIKPAGVAFHYRLAAPNAADSAVAALQKVAARFDDLIVKTGHKLIEFLVVTTDKGMALSAIRRETGADSVLFVGDDVTDEDAFAVLTSSDLGVKVGPGPTAAPFSVRDPLEVVALLEQLAGRRREEAWDESQPTS